MRNTNITLNFLLFWEIANKGPIKVNQKMQFSGLKLWVWNPEIFLGLNPSFKVWVWALLSSLQLLTGKDRLEFDLDFLAIAD